MASVSVSSWFFSLLGNHYGCLQIDSLLLWAEIISSTNVNGEVQQWGNHKLKPCGAENHKNSLPVTTAIFEQGTK